MHQPKTGFARALFAGLLLALAVAPVCAASLAGVRLAPATPGSVRFTVDVPALATTATGDPSGSVQAALEGYEPVGALGAPPSFRRVILVAVPPLGDVRVRGVGSATAVSEGVTLAPVSASEGASTEGAWRDLAAYGAAGSAVPAAARLLDVTWLRNQRVARIAIEPVAYEPAARRLTVAQRIDVDVQVTPTGALGPAAEPDDPFEPVYREVLANYDQGKSWRRPGVADLVRGARRLGLQVESAVVATPLDSSAIYGHGWAKLAIKRPGFYAVNYSTLRSLQLFSAISDSIKLDSLRLYTLPGYPQLSATSFCDTCDLKEVPIGFIDKSAATSPTLGGPDGYFATNNDAFYFFGMGPSGWASDYDRSYADTAYINHPYETTNYYYLTVATATNPVGGSPQRIATRSNVAPVGGATVVSTFPDRQHFEEDHVYDPNPNPIGSTLFWEKWFWVSMTPGGGFHYAFDLPGADAAQPARFRLRQWGESDNTLKTSNVCIPTLPDHFLDVAFNGTSFGRRVWKGWAIDRGGVVTYDTVATFVRSTNNVLDMAVPNVTVLGCASRIDVSGLAWFEVYYQRNLAPVNDSLSFRSPGTAGPYHYDVGPFVRSLPPRLFDVTDPMSPVELHIDGSMWHGSGSAWTLSFEDTASVVRYYRVVPDSVITLGRLASTSVADAPETSLEDNLRSPLNGAEYVVIYYDTFRDAAQALAAARASHLPLAQGAAPHPTKAIPISALYDQFSGGRTDPAAIRNFLRTAYFNWSVRPRFVTFLGDASYDYKNILNKAGVGQPGCLVPTYGDNYDAFPGISHQYTTDDWMLAATDPVKGLPSFFAGRIPASDATTALQIVRGKILGYESTVPLGEYRNSILLLADDDVQGDNCDGLGWAHLGQTQTLLDTSVPAHMDREYVYLHTYPTGAGHTKPGARDDLKKFLSAGVSMFNYVGHGSPVKLADESVLIDTDAPKIENGDRLFLFVAASCDVGKFDDPTLTSLGEKLYVTATGGAAAVVSATERALSSQNSDLNRVFYQLVFRRDTVQTLEATLDGHGQYFLPLSAALTIAKIRTGFFFTANNAKYQLLADAATVLNLPHLWADVTLTDANGAPVTQLQRGQTVTFHGQVLDQPGGSAQAFSGIASVLVEDSAPTDDVSGYADDVGCSSHFPGGVGLPQQYKFYAGTIYHGDVSVTNGQFTGKFVVPLDATLGTDGRLRTYLQAPTVAAGDGTGSSPLPVVAGSASGSDTQGPRITLSFVGGSRTVRPTATLTIDLFDESGIMTTGHAPQNAIIVTVDGNTTSRSDVTSSFRYAADSYQQGVATFTLPGLAAGHHTISVSAADNLAIGIAAGQHRSSATLEFDVVDATRLDITRTYLFPNPVRSTGVGAGGTFVVDAPGDSVNTLVRIYTITGRVIRDLRSMGGLGQVQIPWDGRDAEGDPLANGTYLYKVYVNTREADGRSSAREKAAAEGRLVIVNR